MYRARERHPPPVAHVAALAAAVSVAASFGPSVWTACAGTACATPALLARRVGPRRTDAAVFVLLTVVAVVLGAWRADRAFDELQPDRLGRFDGWAHLVDDPQPYGSATRVIVEIDGERFESWQRGRSATMRAATWRAGERIRLSGERVALDADRAGRVAWQHIVGSFELDWAADVIGGSPVDRASNRIRAAIERAASTLPGDDGTLFRGLVVGDDRDQPLAMIERFRNSGLSHLTAVSGQNVSYVLAAAGPMLVRLRPGWRWLVTVGLIAWFVSLTRFEPSIIRAGTMAALSATGFVLGRPRSPFRILCWTTIALLLIDPLLARSVGFWLSVGATAGVTTIGPWLASRLQRFGPFALPIGVTLGAQAGVVIPAVLVFGRLPLLSVPANLLAVPVAGFVMLYGLPAGLVAGLVPPVAPIVMLPCRIGVRWVDTVAVLADRLEPEGVSVALGWALIVGLVAGAVGLRRKPSPSAQ